MKAVIIHPGISVETVEFCGYQTIWDAVGGLIEAAHASPDLTIWCNEEGKLKGLPVNLAATSLWWTINPPMRGRDVLAGPVLVTGGASPEGDTLGLTDEQCELVERYVSLARVRGGGANQPDS